MVWLAKKDKIERFRLGRPSHCPVAKLPIFTPSWKVRTSLSRSRLLGSHSAESSARLSSIVNPPARESRSTGKAELAERVLHLTAIVA